MVDASLSIILGETFTLIAVSLPVVLILIRALSNVKKFSQFTGASIRDLQRVIWLIWLAFITIWVLESLGVTSAYSSLTLTGIVGLGISLSLQNTLLNLFSGFWLVSGRMIRLGDDIEIFGVHGTVVKLNLRTTWLRTNGGSLAIVSNSTIYSGPFTNHTAPDRLLDRKPVNTGVGEIRS